MKELPIYYGKRPVGVLVQNEHGFCELHYAADWQREGFDISVTLPRSEARHTGDRVRAFFENLLPEARIRESLARHYQVSTENVFGLLGYIGRDCAGAFSVGAEGADGTYTPLSAEELQHELDRLPALPMATAHSGTSLSLAGAQHKLPLFCKQGQFYLPQQGAASNCIIKLAIPGFDASVENEFFCMKLAATIGLPVAEVQLLPLPQSTVLVVQRYDRAGTDFHPQRLPQEDFCQIAALSSDVKYESEGGPGFAFCAESIRRYSCRAAKDLLLLVQWAAFNLCIGNNDAHAKNLSMLRQGNALVLAPFYDLISTTFYGRKLQKKLAMRIGGQQWSHYVSRRRWERFADEISLPRPTVLKNVSQTALAVQRALADSPPYAPPTAAPLREHITERTRRVLQQLQEES